MTKSNVVCCTSLTSSTTDLVCIKSLFQKLICLFKVSPDESAQAGQAEPPPVPSFGLSPAAGRVAAGLLDDDDDEAPPP